MLPVCRTQLESGLKAAVALWGFIDAVDFVLLKMDNLWIHSFYCNKSYCDTLLLKSCLLWYFKY